MNVLPSYEDSIKVQQPPSYATIATSSCECPVRSMYHTDPLNLVILGDEQNDTVDPLTMSFGDYVVRTEEDIYDSFVALRIIMEDKIKQIDRNIEFVQKRIISRSRNYYIDCLRLNTCEAFVRIRNRIMLELRQLQQLFTLIAHHNELYAQVSSQVCELCPLSDVKPQSACHNKLLFRAQVVKNLEILQERVNKFASCDDVGFVLKERAKVYNDARDFVRRQTQS